MKLFETKNGSEVKEFPNGKYVIDFDWFKEGCCCDCEPSYEFDDCISVNCKNCGSKLIAIESKAYPYPYPYTEPDQLQPWLFDDLQIVNAKEI